MSLLDRLNARRLWVRWPVKWLLLATVVLVVLFPRLDRLPMTVKRHLDPNALINPDSPALRPLLEEFGQQNAEHTDAAQLMKALERYVYRKIPYAWDWDLWGNVEYLPTVEETLARGREDCDGRAVVAASVLRHYGYNARLASDFGHVWVVTDQGPTMSPGKRVAVEFGDQGMKIDWGFLADVPQTFSLGVSVFPLHRELVMVLSAWLLMIGRGIRLRVAFVWLASLVIGLMLLREGGRLREPNLVKVWIGLVVWLFAFGGLVVQAWIRRSTKAVPPPVEVQQ